MEESPARILILDDDPTITELLSQILESEGYEVMTSNSSKDVLYLARQFLPDLLLLDIMMPEVDGYDVCRFFKSDSDLRFTRIVVITARDSLEGRVQSYRVKADAFIAKPFELPELREIIRANIHSKRVYDKMLHDAESMTIVDRALNCYNRRYMEKRISEELRRLYRNKRPMSLLVLEVDNYKNLRLRYGAAFADEIMRDVAAAIHEELRESDLLGRYEQGSFLMLLPETAKNGAKAASTRLKEIVSSLVFLKRKRLVLSATVVTLTIEKSLNAEDVLKALSEELQQSRNRKLGKAR